MGDVMAYSIEMEHEFIQKRSIFSIDWYIMYLCSSAICMTAVFSKIITEHLLKMESTA